MSLSFDFNFDLDFDFNLSAAEIVDFKTFCERAGYPPPYEKQIDMYNFALEDREDTRLLLGSRGIGKTDYITILGVSYRLYRQPSLEYLIVTKERERGKQIVAECIECLRRNGIEPANNSTTQLRLKGKKGKDPNLFTIPIRGRGFRGHHPYAVILEDPITPEDTSATERDRVETVYAEVLKLTSNVLIIGQPVHKLDLYMKLRGTIPTMEVKWGDIPALDADLDAMRAAGVDEASIQASYFLNVIDANTLPFRAIESVDYFAEDNIMMIDPAREGSDSTAVTVLGIKFNKAVAIGFNFAAPWYDCIDYLAEISKRVNVNQLYAEINGVGDIIIRELRTLGIGAIGINTTENKHKKIMKIAPFVSDLKLFSGKIWSSELNHANDAYIKEVKNYEYKVAHDDAPDCLSMAVARLGLL